MTANKVTGDVHRARDLESISSEALSAQIDHARKITRQRLVAFNLEVSLEVPNWKC